MKTENTLETRLLVAGVIELAKQGLTYEEIIETLLTSDKGEKS